MANPLTKELEEGSVGELLVIIRLLQYGVQASFTLKDSGNDLIGVKGKSMQTIQVKTSVKGKWKAPKSTRTYGILALVSLKGSDQRVELDQSEIYLLSRSEVGDKKSFNDEESLVEFSLSMKRVNALFQ
jgi:hypothetical protein